MSALDRAVELGGVDEATLDRIAGTTDADVSPADPRKLRTAGRRSATAATFGWRRPID